MDKSETRTVYKVTGISRDYSKEQLKHMMIEENEDILQKQRKRSIGTICYNCQGYGHVKDMMAWSA